MGENGGPRDSFATTDVTLMNVAGGAMERDFQAALHEIDDVIANGDQYAKGSGAIKMRIEGGIDVIVQDGLVTVVGGMSLKRPKRRTRKSALYRGKNGKGWTTDDNFEGLPLPFGTRHMAEETRE